MPGQRAVRNLQPIKPGPHSRWQIVLRNKHGRQRFVGMAFVREGLEKGVEAQVTGEGTPDVPSGNGTGGMTWRDSRLDCFLSSAEVTAETICPLGVQTCGPLC
jgi:hypothetical protein